jgi:antirestriction protein ArdC
MQNIAYQMVQDSIIAELDKGVIPWRKEWKNGIPQNGQSGRVYNGINLLLLSLNKFTDPRYLTFNQVVQMGGKVMKGAKSSTVVLWHFAQREENGKKKSIPFLKYYKVFNVEQCENLKLPSLTRDASTIPSGEEIVSGYLDCPPIKYEGSKAFYSPVKDEVVVPKQSVFSSDEAFYQTLFHELAHSTGHETRLNRKGIVDFNGFGTVQYSEEELVAEFSSAFLCCAAGINNDLANTAAYIAGWKKYLIDNPKVLVHAAGKAQKAADYILTGKIEYETPE